jgi:tetratricopeptide (TPR) repeat protein
MLARAEALLQQGQPRVALQTLLDLHRSYPGDAEISQRIGNVYAGLEELAPAAEFFQKAVQQDASRLDARKNLAVVLWFLDRKTESEREFKIVASKLPRDPIPHLYLGLAAYERKEYAGAKEHFRQAGDAAVNNPEVLPAVLDSYLAAGDSSLNASLIAKLESAGNPDPELIFRIGSVFAAHQANDEAARAFTKIKSAYRDRYAVLSSLANAQLHGGHPVNAEATAEEIIRLDMAKPEIYLLLGEAYDQQNRPDDAYQALQKAIKLAPGEETGYIALAKFAIAHQNQEFALKTLSQGLQRNPASAGLLMQRGLLWALQGRAEQALASFTEASRAAPKWSAPLLALGVSQMEQGRWDDAAATFSKAALVDPSDYRAPYFHAEALSRNDRADSLPEVVASLRKAITLNPRDPKAFVSLGAAYLSAGRTEEAIPELESALQLEADNQTALYRLSRAYHALGRTAEAQRFLQRFQKLKDSSRETEKSELVQRLTIIRE